MDFYHLRILSVLLTFIGKIMLDMNLLDKLISTKCIEKHLIEKTINVLLFRKSGKYVKNPYEFEV